MPPSKTRFVTACQQLLALAVVLAALTPAASVVTLDVVREEPGAGARATSRLAVTGDLAAYTRATSRKSLVPAEVIDPTVTEYPLTAAPVARGSKVAVTALQARVTPGVVPGSAEVTSTPQPVVGYGAVGVTWAHDEPISDQELSLQVRTSTHDEWSAWTQLPYDSEHGPDPDTAEGRHARPGSDELLVGNVDQVQVRALSSTGEVPADMKLAVIDPGKAPKTAVESPALDTGTMDGSTEPTDPPVPTDPPPTDPTDPGDISLQTASYTPKPVIYSRAQWGADERMREKSSLHYYEVHAGFVHHTVNANDYTRAEVPGIIRSIYAYHTQSKGWSDIGYNFVVDRFGRIWEGRYGGVDRPVVGAHTLNYNENSFAMSAIGNYDIKQPSGAMVQAYGALFAWKLSLHGVDASSTRQWVGSKYFEAINGHRDAGQTACPGRYLYAKIPRIRVLAAEAQRGWSGRELESNLASTPHPDLVVRRASDGQGFVIPTGGLTRFLRPAPVAAPWTADDTAVVSPDLTGDGRSDVVVRLAAGSASVYPGDGAGDLGSPVHRTTGLNGRDLITAVGDLAGSPNNDLVARNAHTGKLNLYVGHGDGGFTRRKLGIDGSGFTALAATGDLNGDQRADLLARDGAGHLWLYPGTGTRHLGTPVQVPGAWGGYDTITGFGDFTSDGRPDLFVRTAKKNGYLLPSRGDGTFGHRLGPIRKARGLTSIAGGNLTGNATPDLLARRGDRLVVFPNAGTFETGAPIPTGVRFSAANVLLNVGDWDHDGHGDVVLRNKNNGALYLRRGDGQGHFGKAVQLAKGFAQVGLLAAVGDMTGDGWPDLMGQPRGGAMRIYPGAGLQGLGGSYVAHGAIKAAAQIGVGRWDGDGSPDSLIRSGSKLTLYPGNGPGGLTSPRSLSLDVSPYDWVVGVSSEVLVGHPDVLVREKSTGYLWLLRATATGFKHRLFMGEGMAAYDLVG